MKNVQCSVVFLFYHVYTPLLFTGVHISWLHQLDQDGALAAKDATIAQLQKEIAALRAKLAEAERKYQLLSNSSAADIVSGFIQPGSGTGRGVAVNQHPAWAWHRQGRGTGRGVAVNHVSGGCFVLQGALRAEVEALSRQIEELQSKSLTMFV